MKKLNIRRFDVSQGFDMYTHYEEQYNQNGDCTSVLITAIANLDIIRVEKNGVDVSSEWGSLPTTIATKLYTSNITETLTFYGSDGGQQTTTIDIISVETTSFYEFASDANIKLNSDIKVNRLTLGEIDSTVSALFDLIYPVGSIYYTNNANFSPNVSFNGTWEQIKDVFLLAAGDTYVGGTNGGSATHKHNAGDLYANIGSPEGNANALGFSATGWHGTTSIYSVGNSSSATANGHPKRSHDTSVGGSTANGSSMPPYIVVYVWKRVS